MADPDLVSLTTSFALVPPASVPAILDCVLASSPSLSPSRLFASLLDAFPAVLQDFLKEESLNFDSTRTKLVSFVKAQFHLVKNKDICHDGVQMFIWRVVVPLMKMTNPSNKDLLDEVDEMLYELLFSCQGWKLIEEAFVPFCLRSVDIHIGINSGKELAIPRLSKELSIPSEKCGLNDSQSLPLLSTCRILSSLLDASISKINQYEGLGILDKFVLAKGFAFKLIWDLTITAIDMLTECLEHRACAIRLLLPALFRAFTVLHSFEVEINGLPRFLSRHCFSRRIWKSCCSLFSSGQLERLDAYKVLSLYFIFPLGVQGCQGSCSEPFDTTSKEEFWEEIQRGLVDKDATTRKMALYVLKVSLGNHHVFVNCEDSQVHVYENGFTSTSNGNPLDSVVTRRETWAKKEAESLGVTEIHPFYGDWTSSQRWKTFLLLYEMLEEYGTHLVEAAWTHQVHVLFQSGPLGKNTHHVNGNSCQSQMETIEGMLRWLTVLWERGFIHENPQVRCLIVQSFLSLDWDAFGNYAKLVPKKFILGPLVQGLNDVVHHKDFGLKGVYTSRTIQNATKFFHQSCNHFSKSTRIGFLCSLVSIVKHESFGRAGLMTLAFCISSAACESNNSDGVEGLCCTTSGTEICQVDLAQETFASCKPSDLLEALGIIVEKSKQHFNPKYRLEVCEQVVSAANSVIDASELPFDVLLHFISTIPNEFTDINGPLRRKVQEWILQCNKSGDIHSHDTETGILKNLCDFPSAFVKCHLSNHSSFSFDDDDLNLWVSKVDRWARLFFLTVTKVHHLEPFLKFLKNYGANICLPSANVDWIPVKFILIIMRVIKELHKVTCHKDRKGNCEGGAVGVSSQSSQQAMLIAHENFKHVFLFFCEELIQFASSSSAIFWSASLVEDMNLPTSLKGRLGGPSQRRLSSTASTAVLQAIVSMKAVAGLLSWLTQIQRAYNESLFTFLWNFSKMVVLSSPHNSEIGAEIHLAAYEALVSVLRALSSSLSPSAFHHIRSDNTSAYQNQSVTPLLDDYLYSFLKSINNLLADGFLTRSRRAVLINWKWCCLDALLSIPYSASSFGGLNSRSCDLFSDSCLISAFLDVVDSLENAGEASALPMLRSVRLIFGLFAVGGTNRLLTSFGVRSSEIMEQLVHSSWILHVSCNKRRVAPIAALLSSILHPTVFSDPSLHETQDGRKGPLKWFIEQLLDQGTKSPRTIRLAACHLTGLWLSYPRILKYYMEDLKLLSLHGSVAFDEDFEAELLESCEAKAEVFMLARSPYSEISEAYINTEMYARVSVAVLFYQLAAMAGKVQGPVVDDNAIAACCYGKMFLLELLNHTVNDKDLAKELYKKYSAVHRRKVRAWQMICVLSCYVESDIVQQVTSILHTCLNRGNLPAVRQYLEIFSIQIYLKFPALITEQLVPILRDYNMRPQALSSYVFVAANVIIHAVDTPLELAYCNELLPPIVPFLTSHHHSLRGFTQVLVHHVLSKMTHIYPETSDTMTLVTRCFEDLKCYLTENHDCARLRASMECFFSSFDPKTAATPAGIFVARDEASDFECAPVALMEQVVTFLNDVREDLRYSMAKDNMIIKNETLNINGGGGKVEVLGEVTADGTLSDIRKDFVIDFQKKITLNKYDSQLNSNSNGFSGKFEFPSSLSEMEKEDLLLSSYSRSRFEDMKKLRDSRQQIILVASLLDRIPNLAGLARTCEIFKATGLAVADASIIEDKQFQLISVTAEKWVPIIEVPVSSMKAFLEKKRREGFSIVGLEQTANSVALDLYSFSTKTVLVLGREKEGIPVDIIHGLDACVEIPQLGIIRSLNVHVSGAIALWEYTRQQRRNKST